MRFARKDEDLPKGVFAILTCQQSSGSVFSPTGGWFLNKEDDLYTVFDTEQAAINWIERKMERTYDLEMHLYDSDKNFIRTYNSYSLGKTAIDVKMKKSFWKLWGNKRLIS